MTHLPGNPHAEEHDYMYHDIGDTVVADIGQTDATLIWSAIENHAQATLALAYEQRTVAMINWATHLARTSRSDESLEAQITERLGMRAEK